MEALVSKFIMATDGSLSEMGSGNKHEGGAQLDARHGIPELKRNEDEHEGGTQRDARCGILEPRRNE